MSIQICETEETGLKTWWVIYSKPSFCKNKEMKNNEKYFRDLGCEDGRQMEIAQVRVQWVSCYSRCRARGCADCCVPSDFNSSSCSLNRPYISKDRALAIQL